MSDARAELLEILELTREFARAELRPHSEEWDREGTFGEAVMAQLAELGFLGMLAPEAAGGMALDRTSMLAVLKQLAWGEASVALAVAGHAQVSAMIDRCGSDSLQQHWLPQLAGGQAIGCAPAAAGELAIRARPEGSGWVLDGQVGWVGNVRDAGLLAVRAAAEVGEVLVLVPLATPGVSRTEPTATLGLRPLGLRTIVLGGVHVPVEALLYAPERAAAERSAQAEDAALCVAAVAVGVAQAALDHARDYAAEREQFGRKLRDFEGIGEKLAEMAIRLAGADALLARAAAEPERGEAAAAKVAAAQCAMYVSTQAVQVFGGYGYMRDYPVEKLMRDAKAMSLLGGTDEWHRARIAEQLYAE